MNFAMLSKYYISKILPKYSISAMFAHKSCYAMLVFCTECSETQVSALAPINL